MSFKEIRRVSLWDKTMMDSLMVGIRVAPGTAEYEDLGRDIIAPAEKDFCAIGLPSFTPSQPVSDGEMQCSHCKAAFTSREEQVEHYRLDWHHCNLQRSLNGKAPLSEEQFANDISDVSSISGSESDEDTDDEKKTLGNDEASQILGRQARMFFLNADGLVISLYRAILFSKKCQMNGEEDALLRARGAPVIQLWAVILLSGGHFAAAIFKGNEIVIHKTFHNYTVRAKQGGGQKGKDNQSGTSHPKSGGASLRRYNEMSQRQHIQELMESWKPQLAQCKLIFYLAKSHNKSTLFGGKNAVLNSNDSRLRTIPFPTKRPKFSEVKRVYELLSGVYVHGTEEEFNSMIRDVNTRDIKPIVQKKNNLPAKKSERKPKSLRKNSPVQFVTSSEEESEEDNVQEVVLMTSAVTISTRELGSAEDECSFNIDKMRRLTKKKEHRECSKKKLPNQKKVDQGSKYHDVLYSACRTGNVDHLSRLLKKTLNRIDEGVSLSAEINSVIEKEILPEDISEIRFGANCKTMLHIAAENNQNEAIWWLMENGCDPSIADGRGHLPYNVSKSKDTRNHFQRFVALHPEKFDYLKANIPVPLTPEEEEKQAAVLAERKKAKKKAQKEREKKRKEEEEKRKKEEEEKEKFLKLSDREKRALAAEKRIQQQCKKDVASGTLHNRCFMCGADITKIVPFEYSENKFCSVKCVKEHRSKNA
ncbi:tRNA endonuclease ANKZF1-like [Palaemon carinicauda]|uniref:tRNA endonuclease ANKZF1-like n=1 Tax=Palaemon carinicauda TaxID=392227 RepID=UPI0035B67E11